ncbi:SLBB domain-containing protein [Alkalinema pantanalense CENA528]|uniref:polysaccharide biosynthesis/export family protein n=1 Tax=Alkalinema pantanalense TaxID=1620705 RepID=UPI003D6E7B5A
MHYSSLSQPLSSVLDISVRSTVLALTSVFSLTASGLMMVLPAQASTSPGWTKPPSTVTPASLGISEDDGYLLGPGDRVRIDFFNVPEFSGEYPVLPNGSVNLPQVGAVVVQGRTLKQASNLIAVRFQSILTRSVVTMGLVAARPISVAIAGEVNRPGSYTVGATDGVPNLTRMIQLAEGSTQAADLQRVQIRRRLPMNPGYDQLITVNLWQLLEAGESRQDLRLRDGDSIIIPTASSIDLAKSRQLSAANFATRSSRPLKVAVIGEVNRPGPYTLAEGNNNGNSGGSLTPSVTQAIQTAGGITQMADLRNIEITRLTRSGGEQKVKVDFWKLLKSGDILQDLPIQDGDTISIPTVTSLSESVLPDLGNPSFAPDKITVNVVGEVERPGAISVPPSTPLNQAILTAGGFNRDAVKRSVTLIRLNPNGSVTKRDIPIDLAQGINEAGNPALRPNDIVVVRKTGFASFSQGVGSILSPFSGIFGFLRLFGIR